ncbi:MAG: DsbE family thiol:disulfide interchange protein [Hyphomonadaceae bacterium]|nr:DsbE family thiol:disulfide interchange protein [Hyphomonadaceae bacterium]
MKRLIALLPLLVLGALVGISAFLLLRGGEREQFVAGMVGRRIPDYALERLGGGGRVASDESLGEAHLINVFASWCAPCRAEHPVLMALEAEGVTIVGVAYKDDPAATEQFLRELGDPFSAVGLDPDGRLGLELGITGAPETFVVGADGVVRAVHRGPLTPEIVEHEIRPALRAS